MELMSYGLGGDVKKNNWKEEALKCTEVILSVNLTGREYVLKRQIEGEGSRPPISIHEGDYESSIGFDAQWEVYKNSKSDIRKSYSMQIFSLLGLQQHNTADAESLTMHQFLRIIYVDQDTPASKIFRTEPFTYDKETMRMAIGEYSFGFDDLESHAMRQKLYELGKIFDKAESELKTIYGVLGKVGTRFSTKEVESEIKTLIFELYKNIDSASPDEKLLKSTDLIKSKVSDVLNEIGTNSKGLAKLESEYVSLEYDIAESLEFLKSLEFRRSALNKANIVSGEIDKVDFIFCPSCFSEILEREGKNTCYLCKCSNSRGVGDSYMQALNVIDFQISETGKVLKEQKERKVELVFSISESKQKVEILRNDYNKSSLLTNDYQEKIAQTSERKGYIEAQIQELNEKLKLTKEIDGKIKEKQKIQVLINKVEEDLSKLNLKRANRISKVKSKISDKVVDILKKDGGVEKTFDSAKLFDFDFPSDSFRLDGRANFSASSNVVLKNAFHLAALLVAVEDEGFRLPCFTMLDNIEDKGMTQERSQNFQLIVKNLCSDIKTGYQVIMTTSMVDPELNNDQFGVGPYYDKGTHTLDL